MIYDFQGNTIVRAYSINGDVAIAYDINGNVVSAGTWREEITVKTLRDTSANTTYYYIRIPQIRSDGTRQCPFVRVPYDKYPSDYGRTNALTIANEEGWYLTINAGLGMGPSLPIDGIAIQNNVLIHNSPAEYHIGSYPITIDADGVLGYTEPDPNGATLVSDGYVSVIMGFYPIIINHQLVSEISVEHSTGWSTHAQRQIIGQFDNGDYCILTGEGRNFASSTGWSIPQAQSICQNLNLKFAYNLDGGGSTETVIGTEQINTIYEGTYGRIVPSFIVFNGTDEFFIPNEQQGE